MIVELRLLIAGFCLVGGLMFYGSCITAKGKFWRIFGITYSSVAITFGIILIIWTIVRYFAGGQAGAIDVAHGFASAGGGY